jgi:hypothetical protein
LRWSPWGSAETTGLVRLIDQPDFGQHMLGPLDQLNVAFGNGQQIEPLARLGLRHQTHILAHGQRWKQVGQLERPADAPCPSAREPASG